MQQVGRLSSPDEKGVDVHGTDKAIVLGAQPLLLQLRDEGRIALEPRGSGGFGQVTVAAPPRNVQLGMRVTF